MSGFLAGQPAWCRFASGNATKGLGLQPPHQCPGPQPPRGKALFEDFINCNANIVEGKKEKFSMRIAIDYFGFGVGVNNFEKVGGAELFTWLGFPVFPRITTVYFSFYWVVDHRYFLMDFLFFPGVSDFSVTITLAPRLFTEFFLFFSTVDPLFYDKNFVLLLGFVSGVDYSMDFILQCVMMIRLIMGKVNKVISPVFINYFSIPWYEINILLFPQIKGSLVQSPPFPFLVPQNALPPLHNVSCPFVPFIGSERLEGNWEFAYGDDFTPHGPWLEVFHASMA